MDYTPYFLTHTAEFETQPNPDYTGEFGYGSLKTIYIPKPNCTKEGIQSLFRYYVECQDEYVTDDIPEMLHRMVKLFKSSECYKSKSEQERQEIISYLMQHPEYR